MENNNPVSIIIAARNEAENLKIFLPSILEQKYPKFEVIVANDKSVDDTELILKDLKEKYPQLKTVDITHTPEHLNSKKYALTLAIKAAQHENLLLTDADCQPSSDHWLHLMANQLKKPSTQIILGYSPYKSEPGILNHFIRFETIYTGLQYLSFAIAGMPYMGVGRNLAYKKSLFLEKNGFEGFYHHTGGDDDLFVNKYANRQNTLVCITPSSTTVSIPKRTWKSYWRQKTRHLSIGKYYKLKDKTRIAFLTLSQILFWITLIPLTFAGKEQYIVLAGFLIRAMVQSIIFKKAAQKLGDNIAIGLVPLLDVIFVAIYSILGVRAFFSKNIKWA